MANKLPPYVPTFKINGITMPQPTQFKWNFPAIIGINGAGKQRLYPFWGCTLTWDYVTLNEYSTLLNTYYGVISGAVYVQLPQVFTTQDLSLTGTRVLTYNNVQVDAPIADIGYENTYIQNVKMTIRQITIVNDATNSY